MKPARILIVEDEAITVMALKRELASLGYQVAGVADTTGEAVCAAEAHKPDLVLMDITLNGKLDGVAAATAIRGGLDLPVVFLTAHADNATMQRAMLAGPFGYILKPFSRPELKAVIEVALHKHRTELELKANFQQTATSPGRCAVIHLPPGEASSVEMKSNPHSEQTLIVLLGMISVEIADKKILMHKGDFLTVPASTPHRFVNVCKGLVTLFNVYSPPVGQTG